MHAGEAVGEVVYEAEADGSSVVVVAVEEQQAEHNTRTSAGLLQAAGSAGVDAEDIVVGGNLSSASRQGTCYVALPRLHPLVSSSHSCACSADVLGTRQQRIRDRRRSL